MSLESLPNMLRVSEQARPLIDVFRIRNGDIGFARRRSLVSRGASLEVCKVGREGLFLLQNTTGQVGTSLRAGTCRALSSIHISSLQNLSDPDQRGWGQSRCLQRVTDNDLSPRKIRHTPRPYKTPSQYAAPGRDKKSATVIGSIRPKNLRSGQATV